TNSVAENRTKSKAGQGQIIWQITHHTLVDGGVWSNFPIFIFEDAAFREAYNRVPPRLSETEILGFALKDREELPPPKGRDISKRRRGQTSATASRMPRHRGQ